MRLQISSALENFISGKSKTSDSSHLFTSLLLYSSVIDDFHVRGREGPESEAFVRKTSEKHTKNLPKRIVNGRLVGKNGAKGSSKNKRRKPKQLDAKD